MHGLSLPNRPKQPLPPLASSSSSPPLTNDAPSSSSSLHSLFRPKPPPNFAQQQRTRARQLRGEKKSPFVPKKTQQSDGQLRGTPTSGTGKERDLTSCSIEQLQDMLEKNQRLLDSPETFANLPGGDSRLRAQQARIETRLKELQEMSDIKRELDSTHLKDDAEPVDGNEDDPMDGVKVKREDTEEEGGGQTMQDVVGDPAPELDEANSPQTKRRIAARLSLSNPHSMSLAESLKLQRAAVARDRLASERKAQQMQLDGKRPEKVGNLLKGALGNHASLGGFMFAGADDSDDEELDEAEIQDWLNSGRTGRNGELNDEENEQLNPLKTAYMTGWNRAVAEEGG
ncbi:hypothetical protein JCM5350_001045 [Sporobolomyces pararoseus]